MIYKPPHTRQIIPRPHIEQVRKVGLHSKLAHVFEGIGDGFAGVGGQVAKVIISRPNCKKKQGFFLQLRRALIRFNYFKERLSYI
jgi:hypothetical protein